MEEYKYFNTDAQVGQMPLEDFPSLQRFIKDKFGNGEPGSESQRNGASTCLLYTSPSPRDLSTSRMPSSA